ncbi:MAG: NAD-dependent epimerase/dehydratase family protein [Candidatus Micrarchaeia archaeon]
MDVLIIGGSRFVGPLLARRLLEGGHKVTLFNRGRIRSAYAGAHFIKGDRDEGFGIDKRFDTVIDMCAYAGEQTRSAIDQLGFDFFIHMGTAAAYKKSEAFPLREDSPIGDWPLWGEYNRGKAECERVLERSGVEYASVRPVYILGPGNYADREHFIYSRLKAGRRITLPGNGEAVIQFAFAKDVAQSIALIAEKKARGAYNCAGDELITLRGLVEQMARIAGRQADLATDPAKDGDRFDESEFPFANENLICSNDKIKKLGAGFSPLIETLEADYASHYSRI